MLSSSLIFHFARYLSDSFVVAMPCGLRIEGEGKNIITYFVHLHSRCMQEVALLKERLSLSEREKKLAESQFLIRNLFSWLDFITLLNFICVCLFLPLFICDSNEWLCFFHQFHLSCFLSESMREMTGNYLEATSTLWSAIVVATALEWEIELQCHKNWVMQHYIYIYERKS